MLISLYDCKREENVFVNPKMVNAIEAYEEKDYKTLIWLEGPMHIYSNDDPEYIVDKMSKIDMISIQCELRDKKVHIAHDKIKAIVNDPNEDKTYNSIVCMADLDFCSNLSINDLKLNFNNQLIESVPFIEKPKKV